jgi:CO/xanthine dehydrogenase FAD-binding subunit
VFHQPRELGEALQLRAQLGADVSVLCGGTDLLVALNRGQWRPRSILDLSRLEGHDSVTRQNGHYVLGGGATYTQLAQLPIPALAAASLSIGGPQIRNRGTIAGNLGTASPAGDGCVALLALDATVELTHASRGSRELPVRDFFLDYRKTELLPDELIARVKIPADWKTAWYKIGKRGSVNISLVCCAIGRSPDRRFCIAFGCVGPYPLRARKTEQFLSEGPLTPVRIDEAAQMVQGEVSPIDDHRASAVYRRAMTGVLLKRLLNENFVWGG